MSLYRWRCGDPNQAWSPDQFWIRFAFGDHSIIVHRYYTQIVGLIELYHLPKYHQNRIYRFWEISKKPDSPIKINGKIFRWKRGLIIWVFLLNSGQWLKRPFEGCRCLKKLKNQSVSFHKKIPLDNMAFVQSQFFHYFFDFFHPNCLWISIVQCSFHL